MNKELTKEEREIRKLSKRQKSANTVTVKELVTIGKGKNAKDVEVTFYINESKGTVVASAYLEVDNFFYQRPKLLESLLPFPTNSLHGKVQGVARYHRPEDRELTEAEAFDVEFGKKLAVKKMVLAHCKRSQNFIRSVFNIFCDEVDYLFEGLEAYDKKCLNPALYEVKRLLEQRFGIAEENN